MKAMVASLLTALVCVSVGWGQHAGGSAARAPFVPACPQPVYGHDGDMAPLFCVIDNPLALRYFGMATPHLFALGPSASLTQVGAALKKDRHALVTDSPFMCSAYRLAAWREHWSFRVSPLQYCSTPAFTVSS